MLFGVIFGSLLQWPSPSLTAFLSVIRDSAFPLFATGLVDLFCYALFNDYL